MIRLAEEPYTSISGEGISIGKVMTFVRLSGCPPELHCRWCDTAYSWGEGTEYSIEKIANKIFSLGCKNIWLTGGEPTEQIPALKELVKLLKKYGYITYICTAGWKYDKELFDLVDYITCDIKAPSSGTKSDVLTVEHLVRHHKDKLELKCVIGKDDLKFLNELVRTPYQFFLTNFDNIPLTIQPVYYTDNKPRDFSYAQLAEIVKNLSHKYPNVRFLPQWHKIIWEDKFKGV